MLLRLIAGAGLFALGYYLGKEVARHEPINEELAQARRDREAVEPSVEKGEPEDPVT